MFIETPAKRTTVKRMDVTVPGNRLGLKPVRRYGNNLPSVARGV